MTLFEILMRFWQFFSVSIWGDVGDSEEKAI